MVDTPKDDKKEDKNQTPIWLRELAIVNEGIGDGVFKTIAGVGFITVDAINNAPRLFGFNKMTEKPVGGSDWIMEKLQAGKKAVDGATNVVPPIPETTGEKILYQSSSVVTQVVLPMGATKVAKIAAGPQALRAAPVSSAPVPTTAAQDAAAAAQTTVKTAADTVKAAAPSADDIAARLLAAKNAGIAERAAATSGTAMPAAPAVSAVKTAATEAAPTAAETVAQTTAPFKHVSWWKARSILNSDAPLANRLHMLQNSDNPQMIEQVLAKARATGKLTDEANRLVQMHEGINPSLKAQVQSLYEARHFSNMPLGNVFEGLKGKFAYVADYPGSATWGMTKAVTKWGATTKTGFAATTGLAATGGLVAATMGGDDDKPAPVKPGLQQKPPEKTNTQQPAAGNPAPARTDNGEPMAQTQSPQDTPSENTGNPGQQNSGSESDFSPMQLLSGASDKLGLSGLFNSSAGQWVKGFTRQNQSWLKPVVSIFGGLMLASWLNVGSKVGDGLGARVSNLVIAGALALAIATAFDYGTKPNSGHPASDTASTTQRQRMNSATAPTTTGSFNPAAAATPPAADMPPAADTSAVAQNTALPDPRLVTPQKSGPA